MHLILCDHSKRILPVPAEDQPGTYSFASNSGPGPTAPGLQYIIYTTSWVGDEKTDGRRVARRQPSVQNNIVEEIFCKPGEALSSLQTIIEAGQEKAHLSCEPATRTRLTQTGPGSGSRVSCVFLCVASNAPGEVFFLMETGLLLSDGTLLPCPNRPVFSFGFP